MLGLPDDDVDVIHADGAGCYGHNGADDVALDAALLARACGRPVLVQWTREDELAWSPFGSAMVVRIAAALDATGRIVDWQHEIWSHTHIKRPGWGDGVNLLAAWHLDPPHPVPPAQDDAAAGRRRRPQFDPALRLPAPGSRATTSSPDMPLRVSALRALGAFANVFAIESFMDELAAAAGADPVEFRLRHLQDARARAVIEPRRSAPGWKAGATGDGARGRGIGFARYKNASAYCAVVAEIEVGETIRVRGAVAAVDAGGDQPRRRQATRSRAASSRRSAGRSRSRSSGTASASPRARGRAIRSCASTKCRRSRCVLVDRADSARARRRRMRGRPDRRGDRQRAASCAGRARARPAAHARARRAGDGAIDGIDGIDGDRIDWGQTTFLPNAVVGWVERSDTHQAVKS